MLSISFFSVLLVAAAVSVLGLVTYMNNSRLMTNRIFAAICGLSGVYGIINYLADHDQVHGLLWVRLTFLIAALWALLMFRFVNTFPRRILPASRDWLIFLVTVVAGAITLTPAFIPSVVLERDRTEVVPGPLYFTFFVFLAIVFCFAATALYQALKTTTRIERERTKYVAAGLFLTALFLALTNLVLPLLMKNNNELAAFGSYAVLIFVSITTYAIVRQRLFDIRLVVARSLAYILLLGTLALGYAGILFAISQLLFSSSQTSVSQTLTSTVIALFLAFTFQPLRTFFERVTDRIFYRDRYDTKRVLDQLGEILVTELDLGRLLTRSLHLIGQELSLGFAQFMIFDEAHILLVEHYGQPPERLMVAPQLRELSQPVVITEELPNGAKRQLLEEHEIGLAVRLKTRDEYVGHLLLGQKLSGELYTRQDIELVELAAKQLAVAIQNAKAYLEIQTFADTLQQRVTHATNRLRVANRHLQELDHAKDEFISMASHQLRTPLTTIKGYLSMMLEGDAGKISKQQREFVSYAFEGADRMVNLISDLLNVSRLSAGRFMIEKRPVDLTAVVADEVRQLQSHAVAKGLKLTYIPPATKLPPIELDDNKTRQVIMNFVDNAIYYTKEGSVTVRLSAHDGNARLEVKDTGIGVPPEARKKLFTKFYRADNAQLARPDGTGLGLYLAKRVVEDQGGTIVFESVMGHGSTFGFELPLATPAPATKQKVAAS